MAGRWNTIAFEQLQGGDPSSQGFQAIQDRVLATAARLRGQFTPVAYQAPDGTDVAWTGDKEAPYVKVINLADNPVQVNVAAFTGPIDATIVSPLPVPVTGAVPTASGTNAYGFTYQTAAAATNVVKATPGRIYQCYVFNPAGGVRTFQLFNLASAPGAGAVPTITPVELPDDTALFLDFGPNGLFFSTGIVMASSSAVATFTSSAGLHMTAVWF